MKKLLLLSLVVFSFASSAQTPDHAMSPVEKIQMGDYLRRFQQNQVFSGIPTPPASPVRASAEWEEIDALIIAWTPAYAAIQRDIIRFSQTETQVYIVCSDSNTVKTNLNTYSVPLTNVNFIIAPYNSIWCRDYGPWNIYTNDVDSLALIDWIYNRPRPHDDTVPSAIMRYTGLPMYEMTTVPWNLVHTGGNFMVDGFGTAFSSKLILKEDTIHTEAEIDTIMKKFMGIDKYIKMDTLLFDEIHHIDMHMKLLDEETILMAEYPQGVADGPQIEANLNYVLSNFNSVYGTPYKVIRIPSPPDAGGDYPDNNGDYRTYTNSVFVNKTVIVPTYALQYDSTALRIYQEALPGYSIKGINCNSIIPSLGAIHCITKEVAAADPLLISHQALHDTYDATNAYQVNALVQHRSGISDAYLYYRTDTVLPYQQIAMTTTDGTHWSGQIPAQAVGTTIYYYVEGISVSGKTQVRPITAPAGYWKFRVLSTTGIADQENENSFGIPYPNPAKNFAAVSVNVSHPVLISIVLHDFTGRKVKDIYVGPLQSGERLLSVDVRGLSPGIYFLEMNAGNKKFTRKISVR
jgi:agmatine/peptidylarginine deiminase